MRCNGANYGWWVRVRRGCTLTRLLNRGLVAVPVALVWGVLRGTVLGGIERPPVAHGINPLAWLDAGERIPAALTVWAHGLGQLLLPGVGPFALSPDYSVPVFDVDVGWTDGRFWLAAAVLATVSTKRRRQRFYTAPARLLHR